MNESQSLYRRRVARASLAVLGALVLVTGVAWRGIAGSPMASAKASNPANPSQVISQTAVVSPITHAVAGGRDSYADVVKVVAPAVVTVRANGKAKVSETQFQFPDDELFRRFFGDRFDRGQRPPQTFRRNAMGSGVIVSTDGYILTNNHVIDGGDDVKVDLPDGRSFSAKVVGTDKPSDLALLKITASDLHGLTLGNSDDVQVGDVVLAVGNPLNLGETVTMGIISAKGRSPSRVGDGSYEDFLQTDAPINHGNSGGALVNTKGELVGINSQILTPSDGNIGIGFAIPANMARHVMDQLRSSGHVTRAQLGVLVQPVTSDMAASLGLKQVGGAIVSSVQSGSAAERAGLKQGDVILSFNGQPVRDTNTLRNRVAETAPGSNAQLIIVRDGQEKTITAKLDEAETGKTARKSSDSEEGDRSALGVRVSPLTPDVASRVGAPKNAHGLVVEDVDPDSRAADAGIQPGDVIEQVNRQPVENADQLRAALSRSQDRPVLLLVNRQGNSYFVTVRPANG
jgi:serine protease Do